MGILKHRAVKHFVDIHMAGKWQGQDSNPGNWWQSTPSSPLPHALGSPPSRAMAQMKEKVMKQWVKQRAWGHLKTNDARPSILCHLSPQGRQGRSSRSWVLPHRSFLCADLMVLQGDVAGRLLQPNPAASPSSRGSCMAGEHPSPTHT